MKNGKNFWFVVIPTAEYIIFKSEQQLGVKLVVCTPSIAEINDSSIQGIDCHDVIKERKYDVIRLNARQT